MDHGTMLLQIFLARKKTVTPISRLVEGTSAKASFLLENSSLRVTATLYLLTLLCSSAGRHYVDMPVSTNKVNLM